MQEYPSILLVDDDRVLADLTKEYLEAKGIDVMVAYDAESAYKLYKQQEFDICILDVKMPMKDGFSLAEDIKTLNPNASIIFLTAKKEKEDRIQGLILGADDYMTKPFSMQELFLRVKNLYRRIHIQSENISSEYEIGGYTYNSISRKLVFNDKVDRLSDMEGQLLDLFWNQPNHRITREQALNQIWQDDDLSKSRSLSVYINKLRHRLKKDKSIEIINVYGTGYQLVID